MVILRKIRQTSNIAIGELLLGVLNGVNKTFQTVNPFNTEKIQLAYNGQLLNKDNDFSIKNNTTVELIYTTPYVEDVLSATYELEVS